MINLGKAQIFERKMAQALHCVIRGELPGAYLLQKFADGLGIHFLNLQQHRTIPTIMLEMLALARFVVGLYLQKKLPERDCRYILSALRVSPWRRNGQFAEAIV
jgi:hypothetical protein